MYLENIFIGSEDIRKQLPQESVMFDAVHTTFMKYMKLLTVASNCLKATTAPGMLETFQVWRGRRAGGGFGRSLKTRFSSCDQVKIGAWEKIVQALVSFGL